MLQEKEMQQIFQDLFMPLLIFLIYFNFANFQDSNTPMIAPVQ